MLLIILEYVVILSEKISIQYLSEVDVFSMSDDLLIIFNGNDTFNIFCKR